MEPKKEKHKTIRQRSDVPTEGEMASLQQESTVIQSDRVLTPGPGVEFLDNSEPASDTWSDAYQDFFRRS